GYEFQVSKPEVIRKVVGGETLEPYEQLEVEVSQDGLGSVVELVGQRRGILQDMKYRDDGSVHCVYKVPTRGLLGFRQAFLAKPRRHGVMNPLLDGYAAHHGPAPTPELG